MTLRSFKPHPDSELEVNFTPDEIKNLQNLGYVDEDTDILSGLTVCDHPSGIVYADGESKNFSESHEGYEEDVLILCEEIRTDVERIEKIFN